MAASPPWKVYNPGGEYIAATKHLEDAACLVAFNGAGATIRFDHGLVVWREGAEDQPAAESYDHVVEVAHDRVHAAGVARRRRETHAAVREHTATLCGEPLAPGDATWTDARRWRDHRELGKHVTCLACCDALRATEVRP